ncbi:MAG: group II intron reverse transcriptase/maturase [Anaerolineales bacterium]|nr:group II intron reverse transcriptase/maturase [Anaerolineales bacterium]
MTSVKQSSEVWQTLPWKKLQRNVFRLQKRIYQAKRRNDVRTVRNLQRLLLRSWSARSLAVRQVSQDNRGKRTAGVDGVASLTPPQRLAYVRRLRDLDQAADPVRRTYLPKPNGELRPLGIPTMFDRARQALVKLVLEPEWEAVFEPNSYGFRPGRSPHDAIEAIFNHIRLKPKFVLDADLEKCFDTINHQALLSKLSTIAPITKLVRSWLKAGIIDRDQTLFPDSGVPQGGVVSPLLMNIALHGFEQDLRAAWSRYHQPAIIRFADDLVILHPDLDTLMLIKAQAEQWLDKIGLRFKPEKTSISHTLTPHQGRVGFDFLGFNIRQYPVGRYKTRSYRGQAGFKTIIKPSRKAQQRHLAHLKQLIRTYRGAAQAGLIGHLNPVIRGWVNYFRCCSAKAIFDRMTKQLFYKLKRWALFRHPRKWWKWCYRRYWRQHLGKIRFSDGTHYLHYHAQTAIKRHTKVIASKSPFDGDWVYWAQRLMRDPLKPLRVVKLLKWQRGKCDNCHLPFSAADVVEVHHVNGNHSDNRYANLSLLHGHCHDLVHGQRC